MAGQIGVTYDQVAAAADALLAQTGKATLKSVREKIGKGGMGTIHGHLSNWKANRPRIAAPTIEVPSEIARALQGWVLQASTEARATSEESLANALAESVVLARASDESEARCAELDAEVARLATERDKAQATSEAHAVDIARLTEEVARERALTGGAQIDAAQTKNKLEAQVEQLADAKQRIVTLTATVEAERQNRINAEREAAVRLTERDGARKEAEDDQRRIVALEKRLDGANEKGEKLYAEYEKRVAGERTSAENAAVEAKAAAAEAKNSAVENADLKARLAAAEKTIARLEPPKAVAK